MDNYCAICDRSINYKHRNKHDKTKRHYFMTFRHQLQQPRSMLETKIVKHIKYMSYEEQSDKYNFLTCKHKLCLI